MDLVMAREPKNYEVIVYEGFTCDPQQAKKVNSNQLAERFPQLFKKEPEKKENIGDIPLEDILNRRRFLPVPLHIYLKQYIKSKTPKQFAKELKSIIDALIGNKNEEQFEQNLDVALQLLDVFYANSNEDDQLNLIRRFQEMEKLIQKLIKLCEWFTKDFSKLESMIEAPNAKPYADCFIETKRLKKFTCNCMQSE